MSTNYSHVAPLSAVVHIVSRPRVNGITTYCSNRIWVSPRERVAYPSLATWYDLHTGYRAEPTCEACILLHFQASCDNE